MRVRHFPAHEAVLFTLAFGSAACSEGAAPAAYETPRGADRAIVGLATEITSEGRRALLVEADSAFSLASSNLLTLVGVQGRVHRSNGVVQITLRADSGSLDEATQALTAMGNVVLETRDGRLSVETPALAFDPATGRFRSDSASVVVEGGRTRQGSCFEGDTFLTEWSLCGGAP